MAFGDFLPNRFPDRWVEGGEPSRFSTRRFFDDIVSELFDAFPLSRRVAAFSPRINVSDNEREIRVVAELPGIDEKDIEVSMVPDGIVVRGEKREEKRDGERNQRYECTYGSFERFIPLYSDVKESEVKASFERGVLTVTVPKSEEARSRSRKIPIQGGSGGRKSVDVDAANRPNGGSSKQRSSDSGPSSGR